MAESTYEEMKARFVELEKQIKQVKESPTLLFRVSEKGGVSVYGLGRFPVTLRYEQWIKLMEAIPQLRAFMEENKSKLKMETL